jgi:hypothetical protein
MLFLLIKLFLQEMKYDILQLHLLLLHIPLFQLLLHLLLLNNLR